MTDLTIRNLTATPLELKLVERVGGRSPETKISTIKSRITGIFTPTSAAPAVKAQAEVPERWDVSLLIPCFESRQTGEVKAPENERDTLRLTFESEGHKYQLDIPGPSRRSIVLKKLDDGSREYTAVYVSASTCLAIFSSANLSTWMHELHDDWPLAALSIPGTHNSPTCHVALPSVRCQAVGVREQLDNGVRFFDIRVQTNPDNSDLVLVHSAFPISLTGNKYFADMLNDIYAFLDANRSETLIMSVKREGTGKGTDQQLSKYLKDRYCVDDNRWFTEPRIPQLGEARGKVVLLRRYGNDDCLNEEHDGRGYGLDASIWPDNCADATTGPPGIARIQDFYEMDQSHNIGKKIDLARAHLERAGEPTCPVGPDRPDQPDYVPFFVNFLSASNFFNANCWPEKIAVKVNPAIIEYLCAVHAEPSKGPNNLGIGDGCTGIVVTDWVGQGGDWDLIRCIVGWNARLQLKK